MTRCILISVLALACVSFSRAEDPFSFDNTPGQLSKDVVPKAYTIHIEPSVEKATLRGRETIQIEVRAPVSSLALNSLGLTITRALLVDGDKIELKPEVNEAKQIVTFPLPAPLKVGLYQLELEFEGKLTEQPNGLFLTRYATPAGDKRALMTQFQACDARRMFPCWDEPVFRATFQLTAVVPEAHLAVSNMPIERERALGSGLKEVSFQASPSMPTYLLAFCAGDLEVIEDQVDGIALRVITTEGKREHARYAMEVTKQVLPLMNDYFGIRYPLPKLDQVSFASTGASGMENWGCIIYNDNAFLYDPATSSQQTKEWAYGVIAHEIAHQWFGNLVTTAWWDNLWLNEGFASWMGTKVTDHFNPTWEMWLRAADRKEAAMRLDARATTRPIQQKVESEAQAGDAFDVIAYSKGQSFIRMLEAWLGEAKFREGIRLYMKRHAYSNSTTADLWAALAEVSDKPVHEVAAGWTSQPGFPVVKVDAVDGATVRLSQERFTVNQDHPAPITWQVPVTIGGTRGDDVTRVLLGADPAETPHPGASRGAVKINIGDTGYYRAAYDRDLFGALAKQVSTLSAADRLNLLNDTWALVTAERTSATTYLALVDQLQSETSYPILDQVLGVVRELDFLARNRSERPQLRSWARTYLRSHLDRLGWDEKPNESPLDGLLRAQLVSILGAFDDEAVQRESRSRYDRFLVAPTSLTGDLRQSVLGVVARTADDAVYERLLELARKETSTEQKRTLYGALASSRNPEHARRTLALSITDELIPQAATRLVSQVAFDGEHPDLAWAFAKEHLDILLAKLSSIRANNYVPGIFRAFTDSARADELESFSKENLPPDASYEVAKGADEVRFKAKLKTRVLPEVNVWCREQIAP